MTSGQDSSPNNRKWLVLSAVSVGAFISTLSGSIVNTSLPTIADDLGVGISDIEWIVVAYLLTVLRVLQGIGFAMIQALAPAIISELVVAAEDSGNA